MISAPKARLVRPNYPQSIVQLHHSKLNIGNHIWSRGTGKTHQIGFLLDFYAREFPRDSWIFVVPTYRQLTKEIIKSVRQGLSAYGWVKDRHYLFNKRAPKAWEWPTAYYEPESYDFAIHFCTGFTLQFTSTDGNSSSARGGSYGGAIIDERLMCKEEVIKNDILPATGRINKQYFGHKPSHGAVHSYSSMPLLGNNEWKNKAKEGIPNDYSRLLKEIMELEYHYVKGLADHTHTQQQGADMLLEIGKAKAGIRWQIDKGRLYTQYDIFDNLRNTSLKYIVTLFKELGELSFKTEVLNYVTDGATFPFYPSYNAQIHSYDPEPNPHYYESHNPNSNGYDCRKDLDIWKHLPLNLGTDFGGHGNVFVTGQRNHPEREYRILHTHHVEGANTLESLCKEWCQYYQYHNHKVCNLYPGHDGNNTSANSAETYIKTIRRALRSYGWQINVPSQSWSALPHAVKKVLISQWMDNNNGFDRLSINKENNLNLCKLLEETETRETSRGKIEKDKRSEQRQGVPFIQATHVTDAFDQHAQFNYSHLK